MASDSEAFREGLDEFRATGVAEVRLLLTIKDSEAPAEGETARSRSAAVAARRAAVLLLVGHFEGYLKSLAETLTDCLNAGGLESRALPRPLREMHVVPRLNEILNSRDINQRFGLMRKLDDISTLWRNEARPGAGSLDPSTVSRLITNAKRECIDALFFTFGEATSVCDGDLDVWNPIAEQSEPDNIEGRLLDIVKCRNAIAHGNAERQPTAEDVEKYILFLSTLATRLSRKAEGVTRRIKSSLG